MSRGQIDLTDHKFAGLYRPPAQRSRWKRKRPEKLPDEIYRQIWRLVDGAVRDAFANHPEYLTSSGRASAQRSITKRVTGALHGYATQVARGRSGKEEGTSSGTAANQSGGVVDPSLYRRFLVLTGMCRGWRGFTSPRNSGGNAA